MKRPSKREVHTADVPSFMLQDVGKGMENFGPEHMVWCGEDCELDPHALLRERGWHPESPLEAIVRAIIEAHPPKEGMNNDARVESTMDALTGAKRKRGRDLVDD